MGYRYCPECEQWYETAEYTVDETGETVCKEDDHPAVHGFILNPPISKQEFRSQHPTGTYREDRDDMLTAAMDQGLVLS